MPGGVGERLLHDPVEREPEGQRKGFRGAVDTQLHRKPGRAIGRDESLEVQRSRRGLVVITEHPDGPANGIETLARHPFGVREGRRCGIRVRAQHTTCAADVQHDDRQRMRHEVVHVAGEPMPLLARSGDRQLPFGSAQILGQPGGAPQEHSDEHAERAAEREVDRAHIPFDSEQERHEREGHDDDGDRADQPPVVGPAGEPAGRREADEQRGADLGEGDDGDHGDDRESREGDLGEFDAEDEQRPRHQGDQHGHDDCGIELRTDHGQYRRDKGDSGVDEVGDP